MKPLLIVTLCAGMAACNSMPVDAPLSHTFGESVASMQNQIIPPAEVSDQPPESSGVRGAAAIQRYLKGEPKPPAGQNTTDVKVDLLPAAPDK